MKRRLLSILLCVALLAGILPSGMAADLAQDSTDVQITGTNSVGAMLAKALETREESTDTANVILDLTFEGNEATVQLSLVQDGVLVVAAYDEDSGQLATSASIPVYAGDTSISVSLNEWMMPVYFTAKAFLLSADDYSPLCEHFSTPMYTRAFQALLRQTTDDFDSDRVLNLDDSKETNFLVYGDDVIRSVQSETANILRTADETAMRYTVTNPDQTVTSLQYDDLWAYEADGEVWIVKVASVSVRGNTAIITGQDTSLEEVFDYAKIEDSATAEDAALDQSQMAAGVTYNGIADQNDGTATRAIEGEGSLKRGWSFSLHTSFGSEPYTAELALGLNLALTTTLKYYIARSDSYISFTQEYSMSVSGSLENTLTMMEIPLTVVPIVIPVAGVVNIQVEPSLLVEFSASVSVDATISWTAGMKYQQEQGFRNLSTKPTTKTETSVEGTVFLGVSVTASFCIIKDYICSVSTSLQAGAELSAARRGSEQEEGRVHDCAECLDGAIHVVLRLNASVELFKLFDASRTVAELKLLLTKFYDSKTFGDSGWGECPHWHDQNEQPSQLANSGVCGDNLTWTLTEDGDLTISGTGDMYNFSTLCGPWGDAIRSAELRPGVTSIGNSAFSGCTSLERLVIPASVRRIGMSACFFCPKLTAVTLPLGLRTMEESAFMCCTALKVIQVPDSVTAMNDAVFDGCTSLQRAVLPNRLEKIGRLTFYHCDKLSDVQLPENLKVIEQGAFNTCPSLKTISLPVGLLELDSGAFAECTAMEEIDIPTTVTKVQDRVFSGCTALKRIYFRGTAPEYENAFPQDPMNWRFLDGVTATAYYPEGAWTEAQMQSFGGTITWIPWTPGKEEAVQQRGQHTGTQDGNAVAFTGLQPGAEYVLLVVEDRGQDMLASWNLYHIAQAAAASDGTLRFDKVWTELGRFALLFGPGGDAVPCDGGVSCPGNGFTDMPRPGNWAHEGIDFALENGLFNGTSATTFVPGGDMTRAMLVTVLWRLDGTPAPTGVNSFSDVPTGKWYTRAVAWAAENGVVNGMGNGRFDPEGRVTREQIATILFRYAQKKGFDVSARAELSAFPDGGSVSRYAREALSWAYAEELITGTRTAQGILLAPQGNATRAQVATILMRYVKNIVRN